MKKALFLVMCLLISAFGISASAAEKPADFVEGDGKSYELMVSTQLADSNPYCQGFYALAKRVDERTGGKMTVKVFPSAQLGSDEDVIEQAIQGVNVAVVTDAGRMANYVKDMGIVGMAYFADNYDEIMKVQQTAFWKECVKKLAEENGIRVLSFNWFDGARHFLTNKPVRKPEDLNGVRIRTPGAPAWSRSVAALGATPVTMGWNDVYTAVQQKAIDGCEAQHSASYGLRVYEILKYINKTAHFQLLNGLIVGESWFSTLPEPYRDLLVEEFEKQGKITAAEVIEKSDVFESMMVKEGMEVVEVDLAAFKKAAEAAYEELGFAEQRKAIYKEIGKE
ncbi:MAG: C4-dicarboxylate TRAP transporter substrate-binding protein [Synergistaceae bacterium]|jgi:TRAP-type C4-dicarboxylate transport system substrate-binding protein|uniref:C4-dicarboxylate TRAP transporter substrate-binding protein n=1 Tax=Aminivibrio sp. TaxID=1872489 RepID=UPI0016BA92F0|nr:C4-dicarboxylate TRAP transporter substrate-binding protein [Synergistaceae bacterium]MDD4022344.1 C4-dicarboxylate TRAP transporter substrate-binding protein [Synergistaceae bacterium]NCC57138.1 C4-dicarboxylate ABC transporter substrate-binding protein [Synergistales bacterium]NLO59227.1 TRAP transporter substrate-binding protein DctP [Synergistaceae bacterium]